MLSAMKPGRSGNRLLNLLSSDEFERIEPFLQRVNLTLKEVVQVFAADVAYIHFPTTALLSLLTVLEEDDPIEVMVAGHNGMIGLSVALGVVPSPHRVICQMAGESLRLPTARFLSELEYNSGLSRIIKRYTAHALRETSQTIACNALHTVEARTSRWLLMVHDQAGADQFPMTQEFMAYMLGVRRQTVTVVMGALQGAGLIAVRRGNVTIRDRLGLEEASCECYGSMKLSYERIVS
jgi:CRP-like cAMP-binding protein